MNSVGVEQEMKAENNKTKPKLKLPKIFNSIVAKISPSKLTVDAVPVKKSGSPLPARSITENGDVENRVTSIDPWSSVSSEEFEAPASTSDFSSNNSQLMASPSLLVSPNPNHLASFALLSGNNRMAVNNIGVQNNFNLSHVSGVHIGNVNMRQVKTVTGGIPNGRAEMGAEASTSTKKIEKSKSIKDLLESTVSLDDDEGQKAMRILSKHMNANYKFTLRELGFSDAEIEQKCAPYINLKDGVFEIVYQSLLDWSRKQDDPTVGQLCKLLWYSVNYPQREGVCELKNQLKRERARNASESLSTASSEVENAVVGDPVKPSSCGTDKKGEE